MTIAPWRTGEPTRRVNRRRTLAPHDLLEVAEGLARSAESWPGLDDPSDRCWRTISATNRYEAWVVAWPVGGSIELHDHGDCSGAVVVASGRLVESSLRTGAHGRLEPVTLAVATGGHVVFGPGHVHDLVNEGPGPALSVHVYSPALRTMTYFDRRADHGLVAVRTEEYREGVLVG